MATRFRFRLEALLKLRKSLEEEAQRKLGREMALLREIEKHIAGMQAEHGRTLDTRRAPQGGVVDLEHWRAIERYLVALERRIQASQAERHEAEQRVHQARKALTEAHQAHLTLLRLKERRQEAHNLEALHEEIRNLDEIAVLRHRFNTQLQSLSPTEVNP
ncbi:flagellar export protein FliJ [Holophaga foetida]|uniref:flagellar export protein FliJ n=1 Tax=Holophaga foetida TaxID=35839 RepID=UPI00024742E0|nr:flagellar export protein FliJ [Holophaga foetida]